MKKVITAIVACCALLMPMVVVGKADALSTANFTLTSDPATAVVDMSQLTNPPLPGQQLTVDEQVKNENGQPVGSNHIGCTVLAFTVVPEPALLLDCQAKFTLNNGTISGRTTFWTFQHDYVGAVTGGTGAYQGAVGTVRILDRAPGDETYKFSLVLP